MPALLSASARAFARAHLLVGRVRGLATVAMGALLDSGLSLPEKTRLSAELYALGPESFPSDLGLHAWEQQWFARRLPQAPCAILLGGAGSGREARALRDRGYRIDAFEPAAPLARACERSSSRPVCVGGYEELSAAVLDGAQNALTPLAERRYGATIFGFGSFSHILDPAERARAIDAMQRLSDGPILISFLMRPEGERVTTPGRAARAGRWLGRALASGAGSEPMTREPGAELRFTSFGFYHAFAASELA
ncbi:MAG: hypothetical protein OEY14_15595, partial [Myxococcales bacterium]|nr:hypothetical protein [Myxococcales bacterium]